MCGIFGHIGHIADDLAVRCIDTLAHRGPDGQGMWQGEGITLGHRRLSILDLSEQGKQPMSYAEGRYWITYNGEIYNFLEVRADLEKRGHVFRSESDTEVILAAFVEWGEDCLHKFNGMWAFAIWDDREKILFLSRDRLGKKPLFYTDLSSGFAFASEMKALLPLLPEVRPNLPLVRDPGRIFLYESTEECLIERIRRIPPGRLGIWKNGRLTVRRWWCSLDHLAPVPARYEEQVELFRDLFLDACRLRMRSDVAIGTALSGGLDSSCTISAVAEVARTRPGGRCSKDWQHAFVAALPGTPLDESAYARQVVDNLGIGATFLEIDPRRCLDRMGEYTFRFEEIYFTCPIPMFQTYEVIKSHGISVTLDGHGADELLSGYGQSLFEAFLDAKWNFEGIRNIFSAYYDLLPPDEQQFNSKKDPIWEYSTFIYRKLKFLLPKWRYYCRDHKHSLFGDLDFFNKHLYILVHETVLPTLLRNYDRYSMSTGVEVRMPFLDHRLVTFCLAVPWNSKIRNGYTKSLLRDALAPLLPDEVAYRKTKIGFGSPIVDWIKGPMKEYFLDNISSSEFLGCDLINGMEAKKQIEAIANNKEKSFHAGEKAWIEFSIYLWDKHFLKMAIQ